MTDSRLSPHPDGCTVCAQYERADGDERRRIRDDVRTIVPGSFDMPLMKSGRTAYIGGRLHWPERGLMFHVQANQMGGDPAATYPVDTDA